MRARLTLAAGLIVCAIALAVVLSGSPARVIANNGVALQGEVGAHRGGTQLCQSVPSLPGGTSAIRLLLESVVGPHLDLTVTHEGHLLTRGSRGSGWTGASVTVPVRQVKSTVGPAEVCVAIGPTYDAAEALGRGGAMRIEYLAPGPRSWWSLAPEVARRMGLGRAPSGAWIVFLVLALMLAVAALASFLCLRNLAGRESGGIPGRLRGRLARVPIAAWICAAIACLNAVSWSLVSPPFQTPDETAHFAYVQQLAEAQRLPTSGGHEFSPEEEVAIVDLHQREVRYLPSEKTISSPLQQETLAHDLAQPLSRQGSGDAGLAANQPPLYYALETIPYGLASSGSILDRLELMRVLSAVFAGLEALFAFLFVREALPGEPWAWTVGGLGVALAPLLGFIGGAVNPDSLLAAVSAALFYLLARAFRRGLSPRLGAAIGATFAVGLLTKLNFLGLAPGVLLGLLLVARRQRQGRPLAIALALAASPALLYVALGSLANRKSLSIVSGASSNATQSSSISHELGYVWQLYLPHLPGMTHYFPDVSTWRQLWFNGLVGLYGWADTLFPFWLYALALVPAAVIAGLCIRTLLSRRGALRARLGEIVVYALMCLGILTLVGIASYSSDLSHHGPYWEPRYFLPLLPLAGLALALAARAAGRRWGPAVGVLIVVLILAQDLVGQLQVISRFYG